MRALVATGGGIEVSLQDVPDPHPRPHEALVRVHAVSLNRGEVRGLANAAPGTRLGWDVAGVVLAQAADRSGPPAGTRVVGIVPSGGWSELAAVRTDLMAKIPDRLSFDAASTLPVAGLTAWRALQIPETVQDKRVLITGASGGVGRFAVQLAGQHLGAFVTGVVGSEERAVGLRELGATDVVIGMPQEGEYDVILESVGGASLERAFELVARRGCIICYGASEDPITTFDVRTFYRKGARLQGLLLFEELSHHRSGALDLGYLADLMAHGGLDPQVDFTASWADSRGAFEALMSRRIRGKAVLHVE